MVTGKYVHCALVLQCKCALWKWTTDIGLIDLVDCTYTYRLIVIQHFLSFGCSFHRHRRRRCFVAFFFFFSLHHPSQPCVVQFSHRIPYHWLLLIFHYFTPVPFTFSALRLRYARFVVAHSTPKLDAFNSTLDQYFRISFSSSTSFSPCTNNTDWNNFESFLAFFLSLFLFLSFHFASFCLWKVNG